MDVAEELLDVERTIDRSFVERRLDDGRERLDRLYADLETWLPNGWSMCDGGTVPIYEDLMMRFDVPRRTLPSKDLVQQGMVAGHVEPRGLWIIGANGRVDIRLRDQHYLVVDRAESFEPPDWQVASITARRDQSGLTRDVLAQILR